MIKLIASDLDGTLLQNGAQELNPEIYDLILALKERGIHFAAASGRQYASERNLFKPIADEISYIAENGAVCIHNARTASRSYPVSIAATSNPGTTSISTISVMLYITTSIR